MSIDTRIIKGGRRIPVVAFFGTKGGVGKTTIARRFAELVTMASSSPNVLLVDGDVYHRGMTIEMTIQTPISCKTVHDYVASQNTSDVEAIDLSGIVRGRKTDSGRLYFIPASIQESEQVFDVSAKMEPDKLLMILYEILDKAVKTYDCNCVIIDCGPIVDPYTAAAATLADRAFIIGQNEAISFSSLKVYSNQIREFYPEFTTAKMKIIINKVRGWEQLKIRQLQEDIFHAIPFTLDIIDIAEGLEASSEMQFLIFEDHIAQIAEKIFKNDHSELIPERQALLPSQWIALIRNVDRLDKAPEITRLSLLRILLPIGFLFLTIGIFFFYSNSAQRHRDETSDRTGALITTLEDEIAAADASSSATVDDLKAALQFATNIDPEDQSDLDRAIEVAEKAGLENVPPLETQDATKENIGIGIALVGFILAILGFSSNQKRKGYLISIQNLRRGGAEWLMSEMKSKRSSRKTIDRLLKLSKEI